MGSPRKLQPKEPQSPLQNDCRLPRISRRTFLYSTLAIGSFAGAYWLTKIVSRNGPTGMKWIPGGEFVMGSSDPGLPRNERPSHRVKVDGFFINETEVTNSAFAKFVDETKCVTIAEKKPEWEEIKKFLPLGSEEPDDSRLVPGSMVFSPLARVIVRCSPRYRA